MEHQKETDTLGKIQAMGYTLSKRNISADDMFYQLTAPDGASFTIPCNGGALYIGTGGKTAAEAEKKIAEGVGIKTSGEAIYRQIYSRGDYCRFAHRCSLRTWDAIETAKKEIGLLGIKTGEDLQEPPKDQLLYTLEKPIFFGTSVDVFSQGETFVAAFEHQADIDSFPVTLVSFDHRPGQDDFDTAMLLHKIETDLFTGHFQEVFSCRQCGEKTHWLDLPGSLKEKYEMAKENFCGCGHPAGNAK